MNTENAGVIATEERARIAALLARYPDLAPGDLDEIHNWFDRVASPLDFGILASDPQVAEQYRAYRAQHHDRFKPKDLGKIALFVGTVAAVIGAIVLAMP